MLILPNRTQLLLPNGQSARSDVNIEFGADGKPRVAGMLTREEMAEAERVRLSQFFLVRNNGPETGGPARCRWSKSDFDAGHIHAYFTYMCVERPFRGLGGALHAWSQAARVDTDRRSAIMSGLTEGLVDYATSNPQTGTAYLPDAQNTAAWYAMVAGVTVPITSAEAKRYATRIKDRRPPVPFYL